MDAWVIGLIALVVLVVLWTLGCALAVIFASMLSSRMSEEQFDD